MDNYKGILPKNFSVNEKYSIMLFIKQGNNAETYRVRGEDGKLYFFKLFNYTKLHRSAFDSENNLLEIEFLKSISNPNIVAYKDSGELIFEGKKFGYLVLYFIVGETLSQRISREQISSLYDLKQIISGILNGLNYLHGLPSPIIHNEITPQNIMLDLSDDIPQAKIIDFGFARSFHQSSKSFSKEGLNLNYVASECFNNFYSPQSDLFSVGAVMYHLLFGMPPWFKDISKFKADRTKAEDVIIDERKKKLSFPKISSDVIDFDEAVLKVLKKALQQDPENRFQSANEFAQALNGEIEIEDVDAVQKVKSNSNDDKKIKTQKTKGKGFAAIAGMKELKEQLQLDVIDALLKPEEYVKYGVTIPNGMLLYGPPGCGKTFFAKHFAEEVGFNFMLITPSNLKSRFINATQENIAKMFEEAEKNAPTIIFIDEINELIPSRDSDAHEMAKSAVNEMLAQMDRTGEKGIFIIGATNYPDMIDPAMLRTGRLDKKFYLPPPDFETRKMMFEMYLKNRPLDFGIDFNTLSTLTENYVSSDISFLVNEASRMALKTKERISMTILESVIKSTMPSIPVHELKKYEKINNAVQKDRPRIGF
ncbi:MULTISPECIES: AAA family ATPase [unclassified Arcicella]|uniref:AAA family ATPase n=1 Tax=unclassified Arcicella TaxID=2644986 RepID=UPI0028631480|nr:MULTISPECIES: AAA family ATPase [unclassified Arcicella]MDR6561273.1 transitional endoplasmic reticulum ATPase [Arcicella sp. BE51]MDR6811157.1 transitional endoplasmic reticulum ATPase [Arcicella sp. BE140]MDR6822507.1 transitional endoplasmic reticulum ATPase [Arcicella sp. BE139]